MTHFIIGKTRLGHCKRGPEVCQKCKEMDVERICLLDIDPPDKGLLQRRVKEVNIEGKKTWCEYDVVRSFVDEREAMTYARTHQITDIIF